MKLIENKIEKLEQKHDLLGVYEQIEIAGRTAYKSLDKIEYDENGRSKTAKEFVERMVSMNHGSTLEHGTVYLMIPSGGDIIEYYNNQYSTYKLCPYADNYGNPLFAVTTNYRVLVENDLLDDLEFLCEPTEFHEERTTFRLTCARVQADSFVRHRVFSFLMESTRYCNYSNGKFNSEIEIVKPTRINTFKGVMNEFIRSWEKSESAYIQLVNHGVKPEDARDVLPLQLKTELIMTGTESQWEQFFKLRISDHAHPDAKYIAEQIKEQL
ncbi:MAG: FAD-dependent thymidylate synthase [Prevotella salivae]|uniref:FAD-dependent thymidylate synthase n=1 Tax=Segatella salivae TaxID=228604 RepID=UPI001CB419A0|nr:FAD-dependent thymidylate synthase [Segatella salivae]MBF1545210.1 FAD-dependent thymidylate synthase [Segatella salivae]